MQQRGRLGDHPPAGYDPATQALMSALIRELDGWSVREQAGRRLLELPLPSQGGVVVVPLREPIGVGRIAAGPARWYEGEDQAADNSSKRSLEDRSRPLELAELVARLVAEPGVAAAIGLAGAAPGTADRFVARVRSSATKLAQTLAARARELERLARAPLGFIEAEQGLLAGHSVHPAPRLREGLGEDEEREQPRYVPELRGRTPLHLWAVARSRLFVGGGAGALGRLDELLASDPAWAERTHDLDPEFTLLPLHPLQAEALRADPSLARELERGVLRPLGPIGRPWAATSSLRTLHGDAAPWMIKASLPVRLTNSLRTLSLAELERGVLLGRVLDETEAGALERRHPSFRILREPAYFGLRDERGEVGPRESFLALRQNPFASAQPVEMLATLVQDDPISGRSRLALRLEDAAARTGRRAVTLAERWFAAFLRVALEPCVEAQAEHGLLLSAHQQNLVLGFTSTGELAGLEPSLAWFRDAQGTAYTDLAVRRYGERLPEVAAAHFASPLAERVWAYSVVVNGVFNVIASLAMIPGVAQAALLEQLRACLERLREREPADPRGLDYLLDGSTLWTKGNVRCFASGVDEVSLADPQEIYRALPNPLRRADGPTPTAAPTARPGRARVADHAHEQAWIELAEPSQKPAPGPASDWTAGRLELDDRVHEFALRDAGSRAELRWSPATPASARALVLDHLFSTRPGLRHVLDGEPIVRESFYQRPQPWHHAGDRPPVELGRARTGTIDHPRRPDAPASLLYRRYCPSIDRSFSLHRFDPEADFDRFCRWMNDPVVARFWEQDWPRERLRERIDELLADPHVIPAIGRFDELPFAYFEIYWAKEDRLGPHYAAGDFDRGFHMAVGEPEVRHRGWGRQWFLSMAHFLFLDDPRTQRLVGEPRFDQARVRGWSASTEWEEWGPVEFPHKRAVLMVLTRERFFSSFGS